MGDAGLKLCQKTDWHIGREINHVKCWQVEGNKKQQESSTARDEKWNCRHQGDIKNLTKASINKKAEEISCKKSSKSLDVNKLFPKHFKNTFSVHVMHMPLWFNKGVWKYF